MTQSSNRRIPVHAATARMRISTAAALAALAAFGFAFVGVTASGARPRQTRHGAATTKVHATSVSGVGSVLVDSAGKTLYVFSADKRSKMSCSSACEKYWPPLVAGGSVVAGSGVKKALLGEIKAPNGKEVVTYNHWPLYTYVGDTKSGVATGEGAVAFGGTWRAIHPSGTVATKQSSGGGGGGGYGY
jgi:predicted lipoprotein with Yx(FWY)xxD motif